MALDGARTNISSGIAHENQPTDATKFMEEEAQEHYENMSFPLCRIMSCTLKSTSSWNKNPT
jgi:hypothetical protein